MARRKPSTAVAAIKDEAAAAAVLKELAELERAIDIEEAFLNEALDAARMQAEDRVRPVRNRMASLAAGLEVYAKANHGTLFVKRRSVATPFGKFGFHRSAELRPAPKKSWQQVLDALRQLRGQPCIRVKEAIDKEELRTWPEERLAAVGACLVEKDTFYYETNQEALEDVA